MAGIAGIAQPGEKKLVKSMLEKISHRGGEGQDVIENENVTMGMVWTEPQSHHGDNMEEKQAVVDGAKSGHLASAQVKNDNLILKRDQFGVAPLYQGTSDEGHLCFASEVKALINLCDEIQEIPPGSTFTEEATKSYYSLKKQEPISDSPDVIAQELYNRLENSVMKRIEMGGQIGSWLSGGLDSSAIAALARPHVDTLDTFAAGVEGAPDLKFAREVANFIDSKHHEVILDFEDMLKVLPEVIYHLESFDALLVRSSITNYMVAKRAGEYVTSVFSGEGGDELFAGYEYLKSIESDELPDELIDIIGRLHNTALQRVDRSASAHGTVAHVAFLDPDVVDYALTIPAKYKLKDGVEKWILRKALEGKLPENVLWRKKAKFWEGAGVAELMAQYANQKISDEEFNRERMLPTGDIINTKEELLYYRIFKDLFGDLNDLSWMGRTKGAPVE